MTRRGYNKKMSLGPILASGQLAVIIPPSVLAVLLGSLADISIAKLLISGILPGLVIASFFGSYIVLRSWISPYLAPPYYKPSASLPEKVRSFMKNVFPLSLIIFLVLGVIFLGIATPSEASALGVLGAFILSLSYRRFNMEMLKKSVMGTAKTTTSIFLILSGSLAYSQILAFTGASRGLIKFTLGLPAHPILIVIGMLIVIVILGCFIDQISMIMISAPLYLPVVRALGFDPLWFGMILLITIELGVKTPPFGILLFVVKGVAPPDTTMEEIYRAAFPFIILEMMAISLLILFPQIVLFLPKLM